jgi:hypothetical protein
MDRPAGAGHQVPQHRVEIQARNLEDKSLEEKGPEEVRGQKAGRRIPACDRCGWPRVIACLQCLIWFVEIALGSVSVAPSPGLAQDDPELAYVVSPPPATRGLMPNYLPRLPPETAARVPQVAAHGVHRFRVACRHCGHLRRRYAERCTRCRHRMDHQGVSKRCRYNRHCVNHRRGRHRPMRLRPHGLHRKAVIGPGEWGGGRVTRAAAFDIPLELFEPRLIVAKSL